MGRELCGRSVETTTHHLVPKNRRESPAAQLCQPCHEQVHASFTHAELEAEYDTVEALCDAGRLRPFVEWIRTTDRTDVRVAETEHVRRWRR